MRIPLASVRLDWVRRGMAGFGWVRPPHTGSNLCAAILTAGRGLARRGEARRGLARQGTRARGQTCARASIPMIRKGRGNSRHGRAGPGWARQGVVGRGKARSPGAGSDLYPAIADDPKGEAEIGAGQGRARHGWAGQGWARQGMASGVGVTPAAGHFRVSRLNTQHTRQKHGNNQI